LLVSGTDTEGCCWVVVHSDVSRFPFGFHEETALFSLVFARPF